MNKTLILGGAVIFVSVCASASESLSRMDGLWKNEDTGIVTLFRYNNGNLLGLVKDRKELVVMKPNGVDDNNHIISVHVVDTNIPSCELNVTDTTALPGMEILAGKSVTYADVYIKESADSVRKTSNTLDMSYCLAKPKEKDLSLKNFSLTPDQSFLPGIVDDNGNLQRFSFIRLLNDSEKQTFDQNVANFNQEVLARNLAVKKTEADRKVFLNKLADQLEAKIVAEPTPAQIVSAMNAGKLREAKTMITKILEKHPNSTSAHKIEAEIDARLAQPAAPLLNQHVVSQ